VYKSECNFRVHTQEEEKEGMLLALVLLLVGVALSLAGLKFIRLLLPVVGLVTGTIAGFEGFQGVFGTGAVSTTIAIFVAIAVGLLLMLLSFFFFEIAVFLYTAIISASVAGYLGIALGVGNNGFIMFMLAVSGFILGAVLASSKAFSANLLMVLTSFGGIAFILAGVFLLVGNVTVDQLSQTGVIKTVLKVIDQSIIWFFVWLGGSLLALQVQKSTEQLEVLGSVYEYDFNKK